MIINTHHGKANLIGFERFDESGRELSPSPTDNGGRVICKLSTGHTAHEYFNTHNFYMFRSDYERLNP